jgi:putative inorganic carbon (HCO3(-)) transporter
MAVATALIALALLLTEARSAILAGGLAAVAYLAWRFPRARRTLVGVTGLGLLGAGAVFAAGHAGTLAAAWGGSHIDAQADTALFRLALWDRALRMIGDYPFTGVGLNNFSIIQPRLYPILPVQPVDLIPHAHNLFLQAALDYGVPGLLAVLALIGALAATIRPGLARPANTPPTPAAIALAGYAAGLVAYLLYGLTDALAVGGRLAAPVWLIAGLALGTAPLATRAPWLTPGRATAAWLLAALLAATGAHLLFG